MTYMRSWKSHRLTSHTWLGLNSQIGRPLSKIVCAIGLFVFFIVCQGLYMDIALFDRTLVDFELLKI
jgi:hypothetical protein